jgi:phospholipase C
MTGGPRSLVAWRLLDRRGRRLGVVAGSLAVAVGLTTGGAAPRSTTPQAQARAARTPIQHVVLVMKENRSFDQYFGTFPGANGASVAVRSDGVTTPLARTPDALPNDIGHSTNDFFKAFNGGLNDGFDLERGAFSKTGQPLALSQMDQSGIPNYWAYASRYGLGDNMFSDFHGASFANNLYEVAAQAGRYDQVLDFRSVWSVPRGDGVETSPYWGCDSPSGATVKLIDPSGVKSKEFPCFEFRALPNILSEHGVSWRMYADEASKTFHHNALDGLTPVRNVPELWANVRPTSEFLADVRAGTLPSVSWLILPETEHPPKSTCMGENQTVVNVNEVMNSPLWASTAIFVVWDEWGGFYDHVPPAQPDNISYGFRVPLLVISPWVKYGQSSDGGYVGHEFYTHASFIRSVENNWRLPGLGAADATANDYLDFFDFSQQPKDPLLLTTRVCQPLTEHQKHIIATQIAD